MGSDQLELIKQRRQLAQIAERRKALGGGQPEQPAAPAPEMSVWDDLAATARLATSKFNAGVGALVSGLGDLPKNALETIGLDEPFLQGAARSISEAGHSIGDPLQTSPHFQPASPEEQAATEQRRGIIGKALYSDLPGMLPAVAAGPLAPEVFAGQALSHGLSPEAREQADAAGASTLERLANAGLQTGIAYVAGKAGPLGRMAPERQAAVNALDQMAGRAAKDFGVTAGAAEASQLTGHVLVGAPTDQGSVVSQGLAGAALGRLVEGVTPKPPNMGHEAVHVETDPIAIERNTEVGQLKAGGPTDLNAIVDHLRAQAPNASNPPGTLTFVSEPTSKEANTGPVSAGDMQGALWASDPNLRDLAVRHETVSNPTIKRQARQELEETLHRKLTDEEVASIAKWRYWAQDNAEAMRAAKESAAPHMAERTEPVALKEVLPTPEDAKEIGDWADSWIADRDQAQVNARLTASRHETELRAVTPKEPVMEALTRIAATGDRVSPAYRDLNKAMLVYIDTRGNAAEEFAKYGNKISPDQRRIFELSQNLPPEVKKIADTIADENDAQGKVAEEAGAIEGARDNYIARLWKPVKEAGQPPDAIAKFTTNSGRLKAREYSSVLQGWAAGRELQVDGAIDAQRIAAEQVHQVIADCKLIELGLKQGLFTTDREGQSASGEPLVQVNHPNFRDEGKQLYAPKPVADRLNRALGTSGIMGVPGVKTLTAYNNLAKQSMLLYSFFHHIAMTGAYALGNPASLKNVRMIDAYKTGRDMLKYPTATLNELVRAGMTIGKAQDYEVHQLADRTRIENLVDGMPVAKQVKNVLKAVRDKQHDFLFHHLMPSIKANAANIEFNKALLANKDAILDGKITRDEIARGVATTMNNRFQSQNLLRSNDIVMQGRDPTAQHLFRLFALAPDWTESQLRFAAQGFKPGFEGQLARQTWARILVKGALATQTANLIMSGLDDRSYWKRISDAYNSKDDAIGGGLRAMYSVDVSPLYKAMGGKSETGKYISLLNQYDLPFHFLSDGPVDVARGKASPLGRAIWDAGAGNDWADRPFTTLSELFGFDNKGVYSTAGVGPNGLHLPGEEKGGHLAGVTASYQSDSQGGRPLKPSQIPSWAANEAFGFLPLEGQNFLAWVAGQQDGWDTATKMIGFRATGSDRQSAIKRMLEDERDHADNLLKKKQAEMQLKLFNAQIKARGH